VLSVEVDSALDLDRAQPLIAAEETIFVDVESLRIEIPISNGPEHSLELLRTLQDGGVTITGYQLRQPSLDEVFLELTGSPSVPDKERITS
jgi:ABC-2 type transport system ATP-binding protein